MEHCRIFFSCSTSSLLFTSFFFFFLIMHKHIFFCNCKLFANFFIILLFFHFTLKFKINELIAVRRMKKLSFRGLVQEVTYGYCCFDHSYHTELVRLFLMIRHYLMRLLPNVVRTL